MNGRERERGKPKEHSKFKTPSRSGSRWTMLRQRRPRPVAALVGGGQAERGGLWPPLFPLWQEIFQVNRALCTSSSSSTMSHATDNLLSYLCCLALAWSLFPT